MTTTPTEAPAVTRSEVLIGVAAYVEALQIIDANYYSKHLRNLTPPTYELAIGRRYVKIVRRAQGSCSVQGFVDLTNGNILKPESWKAPAKHARGNVTQAACIASNFNLTPHGAIPYLR